VLIIDTEDEFPADKEVNVLKTDIMIRNAESSEKLAIFLKGTEKLLKR
jgi:hypothetical protein